MTLGFESSKIIISFNNNGSSSSFSPVDVDLRSNHVNCCVLFSFSHYFLLLLILYHVFSQHAISHILLQK